MLTKRCGVNLGKEILEEAKLVFEVHDFWKKFSFLNNALNKTRKGGFQKNRIILIEREVIDGLTSWLKRNKVKVLLKPTSKYNCHFLWLNLEGKLFLTPC